MIPKRRKRQRSNIRSPAVIRSPGHLQFVRGHVCCVSENVRTDGKPFRVCLGERIEAHHIYRPGDAKGHKPGDNWTVPLCSFHHEEVGRILGKETFAERYKVDLLAIAASLWKVSPHRIKYKRKLCIECGIYPADPPSRLCPGCEAYQEHQR